MDEKEMLDYLLSTGLYEITDEKRPYNDLFCKPLFVTSDPKTELILQDINTLKEQYPQASTVIRSTVIRSLDHMSKPNNWLKMHNKPMRRKPLKRTYLILDEFSNI